MAENQNLPGREELNESAGKRMTKEERAAATAEEARQYAETYRLKLLAEKDCPDTVRPGEATEEFTCLNPRCITSTEQELPQMSRCVDEEHGIHRCAYCDQKAYPKKKK